ncbi:MAG: hypothetical protein V2A78_11235 [bacterium]
MSKLLYAKKKETSYENFIAWCPDCDYKNIYNRITDLKTTEAIGFMKVKCLNDICGKEFNINGDSINPAFQMLVFDCCDLKQEKRYSYCILNLAQAFEVFFSLYFRVELLYKPFSIEHKKGKDSLNHMNELSKQLYEKIKTYPFVKLRNIFLNRLLINQPTKSLDDAEKIIKDLNSLTTTPSDIMIGNIQDAHLSELLINLKNTKICELRNNVVHKLAYRPSIGEVDAAIKETRSILFPLASCLGMKIDDINWYMSHA